MARIVSLVGGAVALLVMGATAAAVLAAEDPILARQALMKENGKDTKLGAAMAKGETPFDLAKAKMIFDAYADSAAKMPSLFPESSKSGHDTTASPKIWGDMAAFKAQFATFGKDAGEAKASVKDLATFRAAFGKITKECGACHDKWRVKKG